MAYNIQCANCKNVRPGWTVCKEGRTGWEENPCPEKVIETATVTLTAPLVCWGEPDIIGPQGRSLGGGN